MEVNLLGATRMESSTLILSFETSLGVGHAKDPEVIDRSIIPLLLIHRVLEELSRVCNIIPPLSLVVDSSWLD